MSFLSLLLFLKIWKRLNPPLPQHLNGDWYVGEEEEEVKVEVEDSEQQQQQQQQQQQIVEDNSLKAILEDIEKL